MAGPIWVWHLPFYLIAHYSYIARQRNCLSLFIFPMLHNFIASPVSVLHGLFWLLPPSVTKLFREDTDMWEPTVIYVPHTVTNNSVFLLKHIGIKCKNIHYSQVLRGTLILTISSHKVKRLNAHSTSSSSKELTVWRGKRKGIWSP